MVDISFLEDGVVDMEDGSACGTCNEIVISGLESVHGKRLSLK